MLLWRHGRRDGMTGVISEHNAAPMLPFTVYGRARPIIGNGCHDGGPRGSQPCQRALRVPRARWTYAKGVGRSHAYVKLGAGQGGDRSQRGARVGRFNDIMRAWTR
jgi:hypothetical protein